MPGLDSVSLMEGLLVLVIVVLAGLAHGVLGLGFPMLATPLLALFTDVRSAILITLVPTMAVNVASIVRGGNWRASIGRYWPLALFASCASVAGTGLLIVTDPAPFKLLLAGMIFVYLNLEKLPGGSMTWAKRRPMLACGTFGLVAGFLAGTTNVMVPVLIVFALEIGLAKTAMVQVFNLCFLSGKVSQAGTFAYAGILHAGMVLATIPLAVAASLALVVGARFRDRIDTEVYRGWLKKVLAIIAGVLVLQFVLTAVDRYV